MKGLMLIALLFSVSISAFAQNREAGTDRQAIKDYMMKRESSHPY